MMHRRRNEEFANAPTPRRAQTDAGDTHRNPMNALPYVTSDLPGIGGTIKQSPTDFRVDEVPLYNASGEGTHIYFQLMKTGIPTNEAVRRMAAHLGVRPNDIGLAGLKDAHAVTTQWLSVEHVAPEKIEAYTDRQMRVLDVQRHTNKLRPGHLAGNKFTIRIRDVGADSLAPAKAILDVLAQRGVANYFGPQRFGARGDTAALGNALVRDDRAGFLSLFLGQPQEKDPPDCRAARDAFDVDALDRALKRWPRHYADQRRSLSAYKKRHKPGAAIAAIDKRLRRLFVSAFQSEVFNDILARRIETYDKVFVGDLAQKIDSGGIFRVEDQAVEQERADDFAISATGLLPGTRVSVAEGFGGEIETAVLAAREIDMESMGKVGTLKVPGTRRALRFPLIDPSLSVGDDETGSYLELIFQAPSGCYATIAVDEICKTGT